MGAFAPTTFNVDSPLYNAFISFLVVTNVPEQSVREDSINLKTYRMSHSEVLIGVRCVYVRS